jgi:transcriptional regulator with XRE-family HTH domain
MRSPRAADELDWTEIGGAIRAARQRAGIGLRELGRRIGVTPGFMSQLENGIAGPSVSTLYAVAQELDVSIDSLFVPPRGGGASRVAVVRAELRRTVQLGRGVEWQMLASDEAGGAEFREITYAPGACSSPPEELIRHSGHEYGVVLSGTLEVQVEQELFVLTRGDSVAYDASLGHRLRNPGNHAMRAVWLIYGQPASAGSVCRAASA